MQWRPQKTLKLSFSSSRSLLPLQPRCVCVCVCVYVRACVRACRPAMGLPVFVSCMVRAVLLSLAQFLKDLGMMRTLMREAISHNAVSWVVGCVTFWDGMPMLGVSQSVGKSNAVPRLVTQAHSSSLPAPPPVPSADVCVSRAIPPCISTGWTWS